MKSRPIEESPPRKLAYPQDFLWVRERDNTLTTISAERLIVFVSDGSRDAVSSR
jgi:hypothetical protein